MLVYATREPAFDLFQSCTNTQSPATLLEPASAALMASASSSPNVPPLVARTSYMPMLLAMDGRLPTLTPSLDCRAAQSDSGSPPFAKLAMGCTLLLPPPPPLPPLLSEVLSRPAAAAAVAAARAEAAATLAAPPRGVMTLPNWPSSMPLGEPCSGLDPLPLRGLSELKKLYTRSPFDGLRLPLPPVYVVMAGG